MALATREELNALRKEVIELKRLVQSQRLSVGQGLSAQTGVSGTAISLTSRGKGSGVSHPKLKNTDGTTTLGSTAGSQDTDTYDSVTDTPKGFVLKVITDVKYDTTAHTLTYRTRTLTWSVVDGQPKWAISAESSAVTVTTAAACP